MKTDTLVINADLFTMQGEGTGYMEAGSVAIDRGKIVAVGTTAEMLKDYTSDDVIDATDMMVLPGFVDGHTHSNFCSLRGLAQDTDNWMHGGVGPFSKYINNPADKLKFARLAILDAISNGTTTFCDYTDPVCDIAAFYEKVGARACLTPGIGQVTVSRGELKKTELYPFDDNFGEMQLKDNLELIEKWHGKCDNRITATLGPKGPDFLSVEFLKKIKELSKKLNVRLHMHVAQGDRENIQVELRYGKRSIPFLNEIGYLDKDLIAIHLTVATDDEVKLLVEKGVSMVVCSGSIGIIDGVVPPSYAFGQYGGMVALGTDQASANNTSSIINEMKLTAFLNKTKYEEPRIMPAWKVLRMATIEGAKAVGLDGYTGSIEEGKRADMIFVDLKAKTMLPLYRKPARNMVPNLVYAARGSEIKRVMADGRTLYLNGRYTTVDEDEIVNDACLCGKKIADEIEEDKIQNVISYRYTLEGKY